MSNRYQPFKTFSTPESPIKRYQNVKYPEIVRDVLDTYLYTTRGDRYDILAQTYYGDSSLWWIISIANVNNTTPDSLVPEIGAQIRIPSNSRLPQILSRFASINSYTSTLTINGNGGGNSGGSSGGGGY